ncbi:MAG: hypothetical protein Q9223_000951 [Gallowayella weberi]
MAEGSPLVALLSANEEPREAPYRHVSSQVIERPEMLLDLINSDHNSTLLVCLADHSHRLTQLFRRIFSESNKRQRTFPLHKLASATATLIIRLIAILHENDDQTLVSVISPALATCLTSGVRQGRELANKLGQYDNVIKRLLTNPDAVRAITSWTCSPVVHQQDVATLFAWNNSLVSSIRLCPIAHGVCEVLDCWEDLLSSQMPSEDNKNLQSNVIITILQAAAKTFPCQICTESLQRGTAIAYDNTTASQFRAISLLRFGMEVFGRQIGIWEVLLSSPALSSMLDIQHPRSAALVLEKLSALANGRGHTAAFAGSKPSRQGLQQIDVDVLYETGAPSQIVRVWDIVQASEIDRLLEHVAVIQSKWTAETVDRCRQYSTFNAHERIPKTYQLHTSRGLVDFRKQINLDVRSRDQYFYNLIGKFFPFTESFFRPQDNSYILPDYPCKLSFHETEIVCHSQSSSIILGRSGTGKTTCLVLKLIGRYIASKEFFQNGPLKQILLTRSLNLAEKIRASIRQTLETLSQDSTQGIKLHESKTTFFNLPGNFYPYVCTFEDILQRLEHTIAVVIAPETQQGLVDRLPGGELDYDDEREPIETRKDCVDFVKLKNDYWEKLARKNDRKLPISLVFAEIMGIIKGSAAAARSFAPLTREEYLRQSCRIAPTFSAEADRVALYRLYEVYEGHKREQNEVDYVDRVLKILEALQKTPVLKQILAAAIDEVYVDEVQDLRSVDLELLLRLVKDGRCFHVAGDTAQAISQESTFRFQDLKVMIHDQFTSDLVSNKNVTRGPRMFQLGLNYRSHDGIVTMGSFLMDLLWKTFPETVDKLQPEEGLLPGPMPIFFVDCEPDVLTKVNRDGTDGHATSEAKFGAEQVVLVRDQESKIRLEGCIGNIALILTIRQSKGMEFDDVVLSDKVSDPKRWIERGWTLISGANYREALHCFEQADYQQGIKFAEARIKQVEGSACLERNNHAGATEAFKTAVSLLLKVHRTEEAVDVCRKMGWLEQAAELWLQQKKYERAPKLLDDARLYIRAAECYDHAQMYSEAAAVLWKGKEFDRLVRYLIDNRATIPETVLHLYGIRCKIPLKHNKLSPKNRKEVIFLLGSPQEREKLLWPYEIYDVSEDLFAQQRRFNDLFKLKLRRGNPEGALQLLSSKPVAEQVDTTGDQFDRLIDYTMTSKIVDRARRHQPITQNLLPNFKAVNLERHHRIQDWKPALKCLGHDSQSAAVQQLRDVNNGRFWLERLLREITWVSAYDQDVAMLSDVLLRLRFDHALSIVASEVEALMIYRLKNEWRDKREYSALLEQLQLATGLGRFRCVFQERTRPTETMSPRPLNQIGWLENKDTCDG